MKSFPEVSAISPSAAALADHPSGQPQDMLCLKEGCDCEMKLANCLLFYAHNPLF